jgi:hypothetical protein
MKHLHHIGFALALSSTLFACGGDDEGEAEAQSSTTGSCNNIQNVSTCTDLSGDAFALGESLQQSMCEAANGTYANGGACPTENLVGSCTISGGQVRRYYSTGQLAYQAANAQSDCTTLYSGTWRAP